MENRNTGMSKLFLNKKSKCVSFVVWCLDFISLFKILFWSCKDSRRSHLGHKCFRQTWNYSSYFWICSLNSRKTFFFCVCVHSNGKITLIYQVLSKKKCSCWNWAARFINLFYFDQNKMFLHTKITNWLLITWILSY